jgi:CBS domain-containing protein/acyl dehydratase
MRPVLGTMLVPLSIEDCMTREVETIGPDATCQEAARALAAANVGSLVVCEAREPVGIITESDLVRAMADGVAVDELTVRAVMSADLVTVGPDAPVERAAELFEGNDFRRLPVIEDEELVGIVTTTDLADYLPRLSKRRRRADALYAAGEQLPSDSPEMAYDQPDWEFESQGTDDGVGDVVRFRKTLSDDDVRAFAEATGDTNRLHLDEEFAAGTRFGRRIAHGELVTGLISAALARLPGLTIYLSQELRFLGPVGVDEVATAVCRVVEQLDDDRFLLDVVIYDENGDSAVEGRSVVIIDDPRRRRKDSEAA